MPLANVRGVDVDYKVLGNRGPWVALSPAAGAISAASAARRQGRGTALRAVVFDRRAAGALQRRHRWPDSEYEIWADHTTSCSDSSAHYPLLSAAVPQAAERRSYLLCGIPEAVRGLLLWRVTGGRFACERLAQEYYGQFIEAAKQGGMAKVCEMEHWKERIEARPENRDALMKMSPERFITVMSHWREYFSRVPTCL